MKIALAALAAAALFAPAALAQDAAAPPAAEAPVQVSAEHAEHVLRQTIAQLQAGTPDYDAMAPELAEAVRAQEAGLTQMLQGYGALQSVQHGGEQAPAHMFLVNFENAATQWMIVLGADDTIHGLVFRPAEAPAQ